MYGNIYFPYSVTILCLSVWEFVTWCVCGFVYGCLDYLCEGMIKCVSLRFCVYEKVCVRNSLAVCVYVCVCRCVCRRVGVYFCLFMCILALRWKSVGLYVYVQMCMCTSKVYTSTCVEVYTSMCVTCMYLRVFVYMRPYIWINTSKYLHVCCILMCVCVGVWECLYMFVFPSQRLWDELC